ncbi:Erythrocyte ankyrin-like protein [Cladobotryum mycophilum]|uniref:Erythrocyte ankyrin-like protein n=1 Tax=Cladobotryum mycophilum TaxID=491253 RepID=A0ABR0T4U7_9HYPO
MSGPDNNNNSNMAVRLPNEIIGMVLEQTVNGGDTKSLAALSQTSRTFHSIVNPILYQQNVREKDGSALFWASHRGNAGTAKNLLDQGASLEQSQGEATLEDGVFGPKSPLAIAAAKGHEELVRLYLSQKNANMNYPGPNYATPLMSAIEAGNLTTTTMLLDCSAVDAEMTNLHGRSALSYAAERGDAEILTKLLENGRVVNLDDPCIQGRTPLSYAAEKGHIWVVKFLIAKGADSNSQSNTDLSPFHYATKMGHMDLARWLLLIFPSIDPDAGPWTPLNLAANHDRREMVRWLLQNPRVNPNAQCQYGRKTPLMRAATAGFPEIIKILLADPRVDPNIQCREGLTALGYAAAYARPEALKVLLADPRVDLHIKDESGHGLMSQTVLEGKKYWDDDGTEIVRILLADSRIDLDSVDASGLTALSHAVNTGQDAVARLIRSHPRGNAYRPESGLRLPPLAGLFGPNGIPR